jgi:hypothetical protein
MAATPAPTPGPYVSAMNVSDGPLVYPTTPVTCLEPTPEGQGPPSNVAASNVESIGNNHPAIQLTITVIWCYNNT